MRALVCGGGGFVGGHLTARLLREGFQVRAVDIKPVRPGDGEPGWWQIHDGAENIGGPVFGDLRWEMNCQSAVDGMDYVYNLAADMGGMGFIENFKAACMLSVLINTQLLEASRNHGVVRYFFSSSACVYRADAQDGPDMPALKEEDAYPAMPEDGYGWEKLFSERMCRHYREDHGVETRVARFHNVYGPCFDDQTEVLTADGWKFFAKLTSEDLIAARDAEGVMRYTGIRAFQQYAYSGPMHIVEHSAISQVVTPDHAIFATWPTTRGTKTKYTPPFGRHVVKETKWDRARMSFTSACEWRGATFPPVFCLPECRMVDGRRLHAEKKIAMNDWFMFAGWYVSEGSSWVTPTNYTVSIVQNPGSKQRQIIDLLKRMGYSPYVVRKNITISNKQLYEAVQQFGKSSYGKQIPRWMLMASPKLLAALFSALMEGDGNADGSRYSTVSRRLADDVSELALKLGKHAWVKQEASGGNGVSGDIFRVHVSVRRQVVTKRSHRGIREYEGMVYDVTLAEHHVMMVRRNGKPVWSGNCGTWTDEPCPQCKDRTRASCPKCKGLGRIDRSKAPAALCRKVAQALLSGDPRIEIWGDGTRTRSFMSIDDCIEGIRRIMESDVTEPVNLGSSEMVTINQLADLVADVAGVHIEKAYDPTKPLGVFGRNSDNSKIQSLLGWEPTTPLRTGLEETFGWILEQVKGESR